MSTTSYGNWNSRIDKHTLNLGQWVIQALGEGNPADFDVDAITDEVDTQFNNALPEGLTLHGGEDLYGPADTELDLTGYPTDEGGDVDLAAILDGIDFWAIAQRHEKDVEPESEH